ncbi:MAG TPA: hypothetical protein VI796_04185 [Candidatus Thermoplasmatota archaeon]|nr:hypothetical protein [Candidatus Thermoplasmatota archaeon]
MGEPSTARFLGLAMLLGVLLTVAGNLLLVFLLGREVNWLTSAITALVVGAFTALVLLGRRTKRAEGFDVVERRVR